MKAGDSVSFGRMWLATTVARSFNTVAKLWTGTPSSVALVWIFRSALGERHAGATGLVRAASAASLSSSLKSIGARRCCMRIDRLVEAKVAKAPEHCCDMPVGKAAGDLEGFLEVRLRREALQGAAERVDLFLGPVREVGERTVLHLAVLAVALAQQDRRRRAPGELASTAATTRAGAAGFSGSGYRDAQEPSARRMSFVSRTRWRSSVGLASSSGTKCW